MSRQSLLLLILGIATINGLFSPYLIFAVPITTVLLPEFFPRTIEWVLFFSSVFVSTGTVLLAGVPAALYERFVARTSEDSISMYIWLGGTALLSSQALLHFIKL